MNKTIKIKSILYDSIDIPLFKIQIYNIDNKLLHNDKSNRNGEFYFNFDKYDIYKIYIYSNYYPFKQQIIVNISKNYCHNMIIGFCKKTTHLITIRLTDKNYIGLPINGKVIICKKNK